MSSNEKRFKHSVPVPRIYKVSSKVAKNVKDGKGSLKNLVYQEKHVNIKTVYALIVETFKRDEIIEELITKSELLTKEPRFDPWLAKILICELLWGKNKMKGDSKPIQMILSYETRLRELLTNCNKSVKSILRHEVSKPRYVRVNTLKVTMEEAVNNFREDGWRFIPFFNKSNYSRYLEKLNELESDEFMQDLHIPNLLVFPPKTEFYKHEGYKSRAIILQDKASCLPVHLLNPPPSSIVLDMCAAPGMKTTQLAAAMENTGTLYAVEVDVNRGKLLEEFVELAGATCVKILLKDVLQVTNDECLGVEYILVDPSCTGSGITDRIEVERLSALDKQIRLRKLSNFQAKLLRHATTFPDVKRIVYSTCSLNPEENEEVVRQVIETCKNFKLINAKKLLSSWNESSSEKYPELGDMCVYATPEKDMTNGFFIAVLEKLNEGEKNPYLNVQLLKMFDNKHKTPKREKKQITSENSLKLEEENDAFKNNKQSEYYNSSFKKEKKHSKQKNKNLHQNLMLNSDEIFNEHENNQNIQSEYTNKRKVEEIISENIISEHNIDCKIPKKKKHKKINTNLENVSEYSNDNISQNDSFSEVHPEIQVGTVIQEDCMKINEKNKSKIVALEEIEPNMSMCIEKVHKKKKKKKQDSQIQSSIPENSIEDEVSRKEKHKKLKNDEAAVQEDGGEIEIKSKKKKMKKIK